MRKCKRMNAEKHDKRRLLLLHRGLTRLAGQILEKVGEKGKKKSCGNRD